MLNDDDAINKMMESIIVAWADFRDDHGLTLYKELVENCKIAYGVEADNQLVKLIYALPVDAQFVFLEMIMKVKGTKFDLSW